MVEDEELTTVKEHIDNEPSKPVSEDLLYGFTLEELKRLGSEFHIHHNAERSFNDILTILFQREHIRSLASCNSADDESMKRKILDLKTNFYNAQMAVVVSPGTKKEKVKHKRGDVMRYDNGDPISDGTNADGSPRWKTYPKDTIEIKETEVDVPTYDIVATPSKYTLLKEVIESAVVPPDLDYLRRKTCSSMDYARGMEIIDRLADYYIFEDREKFKERFSLLVCNAKARALGYNPKWPVMFSMVGQHGVGKGWFAKMLLKTYDEVFDTISVDARYDQLLGRFNGVMLTRGMVHIDEHKGLDSDSREALKSYITEPKVSVELKGRDVKLYDNMTTLFSTTNETVLDVIGFQRDRRIIEFRLMGRKTDANGEVDEIPEDEMLSMLHEMWMVMPYEHPNPRKVIDELLDESGKRLDFSMGEIVATLFNEHAGDLYRGATGYLNVSKAKAIVRPMTVRWKDLRTWCEEQGIFRAYSSGGIYVNRKILQCLIEDMLNPDTKASADNDLPFSVEEV